MKIEKKDYAIYGLMLVLLILVLFQIFNKKGKVVTRDDVTVEIYEQPRAAIAPQGHVTFCFRLNGREDMHLPALLGSAGNNVYPNGLAGFNWSLPMESTGDEPYGILSDGTIFIKQSFLQRWDPNLVEIKGEPTGWRAEKAQLSQVNGQAAYIYKIK